MVLPHRHLQEYQKGQFIIEPQQKVDQLAVILSGRVSLIHIFPDGNHSLISAVNVGEILGADLVCTKSQISPYHVVAAANTQIICFPADLVTKPGVIREQERLLALNRLLTLISHENMKKEYRLAILSQKGLRERILTYFTMQSARLRKTTFTIPFSREELAAYLCVNRSALSHELSLMQKEGLLTFHKNTFSIVINQDPIELIEFPENPLRIATI